MFQRISIAEAAYLLGCDPQFLRLAMQQGRFTEFGHAAKKRRWVYYINRHRLHQYIGNGGL